MARSFLEDKDICIVAYGETKIERRSGRSAYEIAAEVAEQLYLSPIVMIPIIVA